MSFENICTDMAASFKRVLSFKRDDRFPVVLGEFSVKDATKVRAILGTYYRDVWEPENVEQAPENVQKVCASFGGLEGGQILFGANLEGDALLFCAWWPWGNGEKISIRIGVSDTSLDEAGAREQFADLLEWFTR